MERRDTVWVIWSRAVPLLVIAYVLLAELQPLTGDFGRPEDVAAAGESAQRSETRIVTVVKVRGLAWFDRMRTGIRRFAARTGVPQRANTSWPSWLWPLRKCP